MERNANTERMAYINTAVETIRFFNIKINELTKALQEYDAYKKHCEYTGDDSHLDEAVKELKDTAKAWGVNTRHGFSVDDIDREIGGCERCLELLQAVVTAKKDTDVPLIGQNALYNSRREAGEKLRDYWNNICSGDLYTDGWNSVDELIGWK